MITILLAMKPFFNSFENFYPYLSQSIFQSNNLQAEYTYLKNKSIFYPLSYKITKCHSGMEFTLKKLYKAIKLSDIAFDDTSPYKNISLLTL